MSGGIAPALAAEASGAGSARGCSGVHVGDPSARTARPRVAYLMSRFPKLTETFVLDEILELERRGVEVEVLPLWRERAAVVHPEARAVVERTHFTPTLDATILRDTLRCLLESPARTLGTLAAVVRANLRSPRYLLGALSVFPKACHFARHARRLDVRHLHAHFASHPAAAAFVASRLSGIPWSFTAHGSDLHRDQAMLREKVREARFVVAISDYNRRFILDHVCGKGDEPDAGVADKVRVIHCGVDPALFTAATGSPAAGSAAGGPVLEMVCVGTLHAVKGQGVLLDACALLSDRGLDWRCHLVGDGPDRAELERRAERLGIAARVVFHGACERERVRALLARADVAVAPSVPTSDGRREGIPVALMEAAACALPLVASRLSGIPELVCDGESGLLVEPGDAQALARALARLAHDTGLRARLGAAGRRHLEAEFGLAQGVERLLACMLPGVVDEARA